MLILVDQDGVLADFELGFFKGWTTCGHEFPAIPVSDRTVFKAKDQYPETFRDQVQAIYLAKGFYRDLPPVEGAIEGINTLIAAGHDVRICTAPLTEYRYCVQEKYEWVEQHLGSAFTKRIIVSKDKTLVFGDVLIDDNPVIRGVRQPTWTHFVFDCPYNRETLGPRVTWETVPETLRRHGGA